jgi:hypothetical protein
VKVIFSKKEGNYSLAEYCSLFFNPVNDRQLVELVMLGNLFYYMREI